MALAKNRILKPRNPMLDVMDDEYEMSDAEKQQVLAHQGMADRAKQDEARGDGIHTNLSPSLADRTLSTPGNTAGGGNTMVPAHAPSGWDQGKWNRDDNNDGIPDHNTPKYQIGRIAAAGNIQTPEGRAAIAAQINQIPGVRQLDEDEWMMPDGSILDLYGNLDTGQPVLQAHFTAPGGGSTGQGVTMPRQPSPVYGGGGSLDPLVPNDWGTAQDLQALIEQILGGRRSIDRQALMQLVGA